MSDSYEYAAQVEAWCSAEIRRLEEMIAELQRRVATLEGGSSLSAAGVVVEATPAAEADGITLEASGSHGLILATSQSVRRGR